MTSNLDRSQNSGAVSQETGAVPAPETTPSKSAVPDDSGSAQTTGNRGGQNLAVPASASRRVRARLARRITGQRNATIRPVP